MYQQSICNCLHRPLAREGVLAPEGPLAPKGPLAPEGPRTPPYLLWFCIPTASLSERSHLQSAFRSDRFIPNFTTQSLSSHGFWPTLPELSAPHIYVNPLFLYFASALFSN